MNSFIVISILLFLAGLIYVLATRNREKKLTLDTVVIFDPDVLPSQSTESLIKEYADAKTVDQCLEYCNNDVDTCQDLLIATRQPLPGVDNPTPPFEFGKCYKVLDKTALLADKGFSDNRKATDTDNVVVFATDQTTNIMIYSRK